MHFFARDSSPSGASPCFVTYDSSAAFPHSTSAQTGDRATILTQIGRQLLILALSPTSQPRRLLRILRMRSALPTRNVCDDVKLIFLPCTPKISYAMSEHNCLQERLFPQNSCVRNDKKLLHLHNLRIAVALSPVRKCRVMDPI